jgi:Raf kinase inhibitor-like YbhB/YbcL family protein
MDRILLAILAVGFLSSCRSATQPVSDDQMSIKLTSAAFNEGEMIPKQYTCDGANISPPLSWLGVPANAKTIALICDDPDAPGKTWVHWVVYDLPAATNSLPENVTKEPKLDGGKQGTTDFKKIGYGGPCPPSGTHRYFFKLYALDFATPLNAGATKDQLLQAIEGHIVAQGQLMGTYKR